MDDHAPEDNPSEETDSVSVRAAATTEDAETSEPDEIEKSAAVREG
jgi:hypothetical protein